MVTRILALISLSLCANLAFGEIVNQQSAIMPGVGKITSIGVRTESVDTIDIQIYVTCYYYRNGKRYERPQTYVDKIQALTCGITKTSYEPDIDPDHVLVGFVELANQGGPSHCDETHKRAAPIDVRALCAKN